MYRPILCLLLAGVVNPVFAEFCTEVTDNEERLACFDIALTCAGIMSDAARLKCFDDAYGTSLTGSAQQTGPTGSARQTGPGAELDNAAVAKDTNEDFGKRWRDEGELPESIEATIVEVKSNSLGVDYLRLDNGQVWRDLPDRYVRFEVGQRVTITESVMGSFDLRVEGITRMVKVKRVK